MAEIASCSRCFGLSLRRVEADGVARGCCCGAAGESMATARRLFNVSGSDFGEQGVSLQFVEEVIAMLEGGTGFWSSRLAVFTWRQLFVNGRESKWYCHMESGVILTDYGYLSRSSMFGSGANRMGMESRDSRNHAIMLRVFKLWAKHYGEYRLWVEGGRQACTVWWFSCAADVQQDS